ncbi:MAG TPA: hypothetical protein VL979_14865 [Solirubrobacteraceae bacterium]|nr:hypothetical protein [Solirubrobacteraceae bacterium]
MAEHAVIERLDLMLAVLQLAHHDAIERASEQVRADPLNAAIIDACGEDWVGAGKLTSAAGAAADAKERTVRTHIAALVARRALQRRGAGKSIQYRSTGLI